MKTSPKHAQKPQRRTSCALASILQGHGIQDNHGHILDSIENDSEGIIKGEIPKKLNRSLYSQYGDIWILMLIFSSLLANVFSKAVKNYE